MFFVTPKQNNIYDYLNQIKLINSKFHPNNIPNRQYLAYLQNTLQFKPLFYKNVNLSVEVVNERDSRYDIKVKRGYFIMDYILIEQKQDVTLTVDKQFLIDNNYYVIIFASYHYPIDTPVTSTSDYQLGLAVYNPNAHNLVSTSQYSDQAYNLFVDSPNILAFRIFKFDLDNNQYIETMIPSININEDIITCIPSYENNLFAKIIQERILWEFGYY